MKRKKRVRNCHRPEETRENMTVDYSDESWTRSWDGKRTSVEKLVKSE